MILPNICTNFCDLPNKTVELRQQPWVLEGLFMRRNSAFWSTSFIAFLSFFVFASSAKSLGNASDGDVIVHLFEWRWQDIAKECEAFLGPKGYRAVQISPPNENSIAHNRPWYERYRPVSYKLQTRSGSEAEFVDMVKRCKAVGVGIIVDTIINHTAGWFADHRSDIGTAGTRWSEYNYPNNYQIYDFHFCGRNPENSIRNYHDRWEVQNCRLAGLADLKTESPYVQGRIAKYFNRLVELGVEGFRVDASKHVRASDIEAIFSRVHGNPYVYHEVLDFGYEPIRAEEYYGTGDVTEFRYGKNLSRIFKYEKLKYLRNFGEEWGFQKSDHALAFIDNHDNQRGHGGGGDILTFKESETYALANVFMMAWPYGNVRVMSSYAFNDHSQGPPADWNENIKPVWQNNRANCNNEWICEHRWLAIANMVKFRKVAGAEHVNNWWDNGNNQIAFSRGNKAFVLINKESTYVDRYFKTDLPTGSYCNVLTGDMVQNATRCTAETIFVNQGGYAHIKTHPRSAVAIHVGAKLRN